MSEANTPATPQTPLARGLAMLASKAAERAETSPAPTPPAEAPADPATPGEETIPGTEAPPESLPAGEPPKAPPPAPPEPKAEEDLRLSRALRAAQEKERQAFEATKRAKELESRLKAAEDAAAARKSMTPLDVLKEHGYTYEQLTQDIVEGKFKPPTPEQVAHETVSSEVADLRKQVEAMRLEREERDKTQRFEATTAQLAQELKDNAKDFPILATLPWAARSILERSQRDGKTLVEVARELESAARQDVQTVFGSDETLKVFLTDDGIKSRVLNLLGIKPQPASPASNTQGENGARKGAPSAIPQAKASDAGTRVKASKPQSTEDRVKAGLAHLDGRRSG